MLIDHQYHVLFPAGVPSAAPLYVHINILCSVHEHSLTPLHWVAKASNLSTSRHFSSLYVYDTRMCNTENVFFLTKSNRVSPCHPPLCHIRGNKRGPAPWCVLPLHDACSTNSPSICMWQSAKQLGVPTSSPRTNSQTFHKHFTNIHDHTNIHNHIQPYKYTHTLMQTVLQNIQGSNVTLCDGHEIHYTWKFSSDICFISEKGWRVRMWVYVTMVRYEMPLLQAMPEPAFNMVSTCFAEVHVILGAFQHTLPPLFVVLFALCKPTFSIPLVAALTIVYATFKYIL